MKRKTEGGFSLMELLYVLAIMALVAAIAYPVYTAQARKARRAEAKIALLELMERMERHYLRKGEYVSDLTLLGYTDPPTTADGHYLLTATLKGDGTYLLEAIPRDGPQADDRCGRLSLSSRGLKNSEAGDPSCW